MGEYTNLRVLHHQSILSLVPTASLSNRGSWQRKPNGNGPPAIAIETGGRRRRSKDLSHISNITPPLLLLFLFLFLLLLSPPPPPTTWKIFNSSNRDWLLATTIGFRSGSVRTGRESSGSSTIRRFTFEEEEETSGEWGRRLG